MRGPCTDSVLVPILHPEKVWIGRERRTVANPTTRLIDYGFRAHPHHAFHRLSLYFGPVPADSPLWHAPIPPRCTLGTLMRALHACGRLHGFTARRPRCMNA